jgi:drug/metabolite transporter (DMT)-like permease
MRRHVSSRGARDNRAMSAPLLMLCASLLFAAMGVCVKLAAAQYSSGEIVFYRSLAGVFFMFGLARWRGVLLATTLPAMHFWRSASGVIALVLWFHAIGGLPLATAMTLNYMSSVWMALFLIGGSVLISQPPRRGRSGMSALERPCALIGSRRTDGRLFAAVLAGFAGVALLLRPTVDQQQAWHGVTGLLSGMLAAMAYLQVTALGRAGEPEERIVFYFSIGGIAVGALWMLWHGASAHTARGLGLLLAIGVLATVAQTMMTRAYRIGRTLVNASLQYLGIVFSFVFGVLLFNDAVTASALAGIVLIIAAGMYATLLRTRQQPATASPPNET